MTIVCLLVPDYQLHFWIWVLSSLKNVHEFLGEIPALMKSGFSVKWIHQYPDQNFISISSEAASSGDTIFNFLRPTTLERTANETLCVFTFSIYSFHHFVCFYISQQHYVFCLHHWVTSILYFNENLVNSKKKTNTFCGKPEWVKCHSTENWIPWFQKNV